jgi:hypothetical protein
VAFTVSPNLEFISVSVEMAPKIQTDLMGSFSILNYGELFLTASTRVAPFTIGFRLNTAIFQDQDVIGIRPVTVLPNGSNLPLPLTNAIVELRGPAPVHPEIDPLGYVDILGLRWLGAGAEVRLFERVIPAGLTLAHDFFRNESTGRPGIVVGVYGPAPQDSGYSSLGGIVIFGDAGRLIDLWRKRREGREQRANQGMISASHVNQFRLVDRAPTLKVRIVK